MRHIAWTLIWGLSLLGCEGPEAGRPAAPSRSETSIPRNPKLPRSGWTAAQLRQAPVRLPALGEGAPHPFLADGLGELLTPDGTPAPAERVEAVAAARGLRLARDRVQVVVHLETAPEALRGETLDLGGIELAVDAVSDHRVQGWVRLTDLARLSETRGVRAVTAPRLPERTAVSEGVAHVQATSLHNLGIRGQGRKVAILDVGFSGYQALLGTELPASVTTRSFFGPAPGDITGDGEVHGVAVAEVVHDLVPDAQLYLVNFDSEVTFRSAVDWLIAQGVHLITTSTGTYQWEGVDGRGPAAQKANAARNAGILFTAAAGNDGNAHYRATFTPSSVAEYHRFYPEGGNVLLLADDGTDVYYIPANAPIVVGLVWDDWGANDGTPSSTVDYDLYLVYFDEGSGSWAQVTSSTDVQNGSAYPREWIGVYAPLQAVYGIVVAKKTAGTPNRPFDLHVLNIFGDVLPLIEPGLRTAAQSIVSPCVGERVLCIGATYLSDELAPYSSQGPSHPRPDQTTIPKPDFTAPTNVSTVTYPKEASNPEGFGGTSAAAPHAAGVAALFLQLAAGNADVAEAQMRAAAVDLGAPGRDNAFGWGRVRAVPCWEALCDDGLSCTVDQCDETRGCLHEPGGGGCLIAGVCRAPGEVNPDNPCQVCDLANPTAWSPVQEQTPCEEDGLLCTADVCSMGTCTHFVTSGCLIDGVCRANGEENPENPCQWCAPANRTQWTSKPPQSPCEDGLFCTTGETCNGSGVCEGGLLRDCSAVADACNTAICDEGLRVCRKVPKEDLTPCPDDGNSCTLDRCEAGVCSHPAVPNDCGVRVCGTSPNGCYSCGTCPEGFGCTAQGQCSDLCAGVQCPECQACSEGACVPADNGNACTSDGNPCTADVCRNGTCTHDPAPGDPPCDDGDLCTRQDRCRNGVCIGEDPVLCVALDACHLVGTCDPATGQCSNPTADDGTPCLSDGNDCTADLCRAGVCQHHPADDLTRCESDGLPCTADHCVQGICSHPVTSGCLIGGTCFAAEAQDPGNSCQVCQPERSATSWSPKADGARCEDGLYCTISDECRQGICHGGNPRDCSSLDTGECQIGVCSEENRSCIPENRPDGTPCGDSFSCRNGLLVRADACRDGVCLDGGTQDCSPYAGCTPQESCRTDCQEEGDCVPGYRCVASVCVPNRPPAADAGPDQEVLEETEVRLEGGASSDPDGDPLTFAWVQIAGQEVLLDSPNVAAPRFQAPSVEADEDLVFQLVVFDGLLTSAPDQVTIRVRDVPETPDGGEDTPGDDQATIADAPGEDVALPDGAAEETPLPDAPRPDTLLPDQAPADSGPSDLQTDRGPGTDTGGTDYGVLPLDLGPGDAGEDGQTGGGKGGCVASGNQTPSSLWLLVGSGLLAMLGRRRARSSVPRSPR